MEYLFLDTNVYLGCALLTETHSDPNLVSQLKQAMSAKRITLIVPSAVRAEFLGKHREILDEIEGQMNALKATVNQAKLKSNRDRNRILGTIDDLMAERTAAFSKATNGIEELWKSPSCIMLAPSGDSLARAIDRSIAHLAPADGKHIVDQDCLVLEQLVTGLPRNATSLIFCTENTDDFCEKKNKSALRPDITGCFRIPVSYYGTLPHLLRALDVTPHPAAVEEYSEAVQSLREQGQRIIRPLRRFYEITVNKDFDPEHWIGQFVVSLKEAGIIPHSLRLRHLGDDLAGTYGIQLSSYGGDGQLIREKIVASDGILTCQIAAPTKSFFWTRPRHRVEAESSSIREWSLSFGK